MFPGVFPFTYLVCLFFLLWTQAFACPNTFFDSNEQHRAPVSRSLFNKEQLDRLLYEKMLMHGTYYSNSERAQLRANVDTIFETAEAPESRRALERYLLQHAIEESNLIALRRSALDILMWRRETPGSDLKLNLIAIEYLSSTIQKRLDQAAAVRINFQSFTNAIDAWQESIQTRLVDHNEAPSYSGAHHIELEFMGRLIDFSLSGLVHGHKDQVAPILDRTIEMAELLLSHPKISVDLVLEDIADVLFESLGRHAGPHHVAQILEMLSVKQYRNDFAALSPTLNRQQYRRLHQRYGNQARALEFIYKALMRVEGIENALAESFFSGVMSSNRHLSLRSLNIEPFLNAKLSALRQWSEMAEMSSNPHAFIDAWGVHTKPHFRHHMGLEHLLSTRSEKNSSYLSEAIAELRQALPESNTASPYLNHLLETVVFVLRDLKKYGSKEDFSEDMLHLGAIAYEFLDFNQQHDLSNPSLDETAWEFIDVTVEAHRKFDVELPKSVLQLIKPNDPLHKKLSSSKRYFDQKILRLLQEIQDSEPYGP